MSPPQISVADLHVGSAVYSSRGEKIGRLRFMVVDPDSESVSHLVLEKGMLLAHDVLSPVNAVAQVLHRGIFLDLTSEEILALPEFNEGRYLQRERGGGGDRDNRDRGDRDNRDRGDRDNRDRGDRDNRDRGDRDGGRGGDHRRSKRFRRH